MHQKQKPLYTRPEIAAENNIYKVEYYWPKIDDNFGFGGIVNL